MRKVSVEVEQYCVVYSQYKYGFDVIIIGV